MVAHWRPTCSVAMLQRRAALLRDIRAFFYQRGVLEVETPLLAQGSGTDPNLAFFTTEYHVPGYRQPLYLQTSPEFAMKRLLAAGSGSIFQICKAFRNGESGRYHNPEFTLLEWYRVGFGLAGLMDETDSLIAALATGLPLKPTLRISYQALFRDYTGLDALQFCLADYQDFALANGLPEALALCGEDHALWLDLLFSHKIQPHLGLDALCLVYGYPACQSSLARANAEDDRTVERVELFFNGVELGNGYHELADVDEQEARFDREIHYRQQYGLPPPAKDLRLLAALTEGGLPDCAGMAIGLDRLLMVLAGAAHMEDTIAFPITRA